MSVLPSVQPFHEIAYPLWLTSAICEIWFALSGILDQFPKWSPISREIYLDRLDIRYDRDGEPSQLALIDVFVSTENPLKKPPLITANTVLSILSVDYPVDKLAIVGRPNVGKSTLPNTLLQEDRVLVGPEAGFTRDAIRTQFEFQGRTIYLVDTAGWLQRTKLEKGASSLSIMRSRKSLLRAHIIALVLDADEIVNAKQSMKHAEVVIARRAVEEGRGLVVIVNKMDFLRGKDKSSSYEQIMEVVQKEIQTVIPQVTGIPVLFISALEVRGRTIVLHQVIDTYEKWCTRLSTTHLNHWLQKVMSRHSWKDRSTLA
ncbi:hypothetical protein KIW84_031987 [Lathyrus oleraceus]|uniref:G domain-containing protein n=1 Tax=Pisum sativum TaxID=3888 RepID=A0A9D4XTY1_PEA|nr:hypothetical protein KIW84_031987 [Pisum sativum]